MKSAESSKLSGLSAFHFNVLIPIEKKKAGGNPPAL
jgi:hypothetical protein